MLQFCLCFSHKHTHTHTHTPILVKISSDVCEAAHGTGWTYPRTHTGLPSDIWTEKKRTIPTGPVPVKRLSSGILAPSQHHAEFCKQIDFIRCIEILRLPGTTCVVWYLSIHSPEAIFDFILYILYACGWQCFWGTDGLWGLVSLERWISLSVVCHWPGLCFLGASLSNHQECRESSNWESLCHSTMVFV